MTIIVAYLNGNRTQTIMGADKLSIAGSQIVNNKAVKCYQCKHFMIGLSGLSEISVDIENGILNFNDIKMTYKDIKTKLHPRILKYANRNKKEKNINSEGFYHSDTSVVICTKNKIIEMDCFGDIIDHTERGYACIGCGSQYSLGFLSGLKYLMQELNSSSKLNSSSIISDDNIVISALNTASINSTNIGHVYDLFYPK